MPVRTICPTATPVERKLGLGSYLKVSAAQSAETLASGAAKAAKENRKNTAVLHVEEKAARSVL